MPRHYGLIGFPLSHSFSGEYFTQKFKKMGLTLSRYDLFPIQNIHDTIQLINQDEYLMGLNVTIPFKKSVIPLLNSLSQEALEVGAVNTIRIERENKKIITIGYNTDAYGFAQSIKPFLESHHHRALILGNGGGANAVKFVLNKLGIDFFVVTRNPKLKNEIDYSQLNETIVKNHFFVINTTPLGMFPNTNEFPLFPYEHLTLSHLAVDLIYNPEKTVFLNNAEKMGAKILNGKSMLLLQADKAFEIWNEKR